MNVNRPVVFNYGTDETTVDQTQSNTETNAKEEIKEEESTKKSVSFSQDTKPPTKSTKPPTKATKQSAAKKRKPKPKQGIQFNSSFPTFTDPKSDPESDEKAAQLRKEIEERVRKEKDVYLKQEQLIDTPIATASFLKECVQIHIFLD